ncbi:MAG: uncharacterized protein A8A55_1273 [Amphiamblys sp. WSBS2006]|nr:MAG: uncharacterized protein A8A55_1273 [Amphiamblys sp. WSBS2006]
MGQTGKDVPASTKERLLHQRTHIHAACFLTAGQEIFASRGEQRKITREDIDGLDEVQESLQRKYNAPQSILDRTAELSVELLKYNKSEAVPGIEYITAFWMAQIFFIEDRIQEKRRNAEFKGIIFDSSRIVNDTIPIEFLVAEIDTTMTNMMEFIQFHIHLLRMQNVLTHDEFSVLGKARERIVESIRKHVASNVAGQKEEEKDENIPIAGLRQKAESGLTVEYGGEIKALFEKDLSTRRKSLASAMERRYNKARRYFFILLTETQADREKELGRIAASGYDFMNSLFNIITILFTSMSGESAVREYKKFVQENTAQTHYRSLFVIDMVYARYSRNGDRFFRCSTRDLHRYLLDVLVWHGELPVYEERRMGGTGQCLNTCLGCLFRERPDISYTKTTFWYTVRYRIDVLLNILSEFVSLSDKTKRNVRNVFCGLMKRGKTRIFMENGTKWGVVLVLCILLRHKKMEQSVSVVMCAATAVDGYDGWDARRFGVSVWKDNGRYEEVVEECSNEAAYERHHGSSIEIEEHTESFLQRISDDYRSFIAEHKYDGV